MNEKLSADTANQERLQKERIPDPEIEQLLIESKAVNEGGQSHILRLDTSRLSPAARSALKKIGCDPSQTKAEGLDPDAHAMKLLKLYVPKKGRLECEMQRRSHNAIERYAAENPRAMIARVPVPTKELEITLDERTKDQLRQKGIFHIGNEAQLIAMDFVAGEDLGVIFYRWILKQEKVLNHDAMRSVNFSKLHEMVAPLLGFAKLPEDDGLDALERSLREQRVIMENVGKMYAYLEKNNFKLPKEIVVQIENGLRIMHENNILHGDSFERNYMIAGGWESIQNYLAGESKIPPQVFIVDFGNARDHQVEGVDDFAVVRRLRQVVETREEKETKASKGEIAELDRLERVLSKKVAWVDLLKRIEKGAGTDPVASIVEKAWLATAGVDTSKLEEFLVLIRYLVKSNLLDAKQTRKILPDFIKQRRLSPYHRNRIERFYKEQLEQVEPAA